MTRWVIIAVTGAVGAGCRFVLDHVLTAWRGGHFPLGTFVVNLSASLLAGAVLGAALGGAVPGGMASAATLGFLGGYSTFSTYMVETVRLLEERRLTTAGLYAVGSLALGVLAAVVGFALGAAL